MNIPESCIQNCLRKAEIESISERDAWGLPHGGLDRYESIFDSVFDQDIGEYLKTRKQSLKENGVLDLMGFGIVLDDLFNRDIPYSWGASLSLESERSIVQRTDEFNTNNIYRFTGNVLFEDTWKEIHKFKVQHNLEKFGLIFWAPAGGLSPEYITDSIYVYDWLMQNVWNQLSSASGILLAEIPWWVDEMYPSVFDNWWDHLEKEWRHEGKSRSFRLESVWRKTIAIPTILLEKTPQRRSLPHIIQ